MENNIQPLKLVKTNTYKSYHENKGYMIDEDGRPVEPVCLPFCA